MGNALNHMDCHRYIDGVLFSGVRQVGDYSVTIKINTVSKVYQVMDSET
jgi:hypothetical protein